MLACQRLIIEGIYASWAARDVAGVGACLHRDAVYTLHLPPGAWPLAGAVRGKDRIVTSLDQLLHDFDVVEYRPLRIKFVDDAAVSQAKIQYVHRATGIVYESTVRNTWRFEGDKIRAFEVIHDAERLRAFFEMVSRAGVEA